MADPKPPAEPDAQEPLAKYRAKRSADRTTEPFGSAAGVEAPEGEPAEARTDAAAPQAAGTEAAAAEAPPWKRPRLFVVQKHDARRLHYDFRLEWGGVLRSWAVPKGPSPDPAEKRLAVEVEDHPVEYADFEGVIPEDNYGAGPVIVWDRGTWLPLEDPDAGLDKGKLLFDLKGYKLRGEWTLVRTKSKGREKSKEWLLIKHTDAWAGPEGQRPFGGESVLSGLTLEELAAGPQRAGEVRAELERLAAPRQPVAAADVRVMLAETAERPFSSPEWLFEMKYDGFRLLAVREGGQARLVYRRGSDATAIYPELQILNAPKDCRALLGADVASPRPAEGRADFVHLFVKNRAALVRDLPKARQAMKADGMLWVSWYKKSAKIPTDVTEDGIRQLALAGDLVDVKVCAVDDAWSGLKLVVRKRLR